MDFDKVADYDSIEYSVACFAMVCHHRGQRDWRCAGHAFIEQLNLPECFRFDAAG